MLATKTVDCSPKFLQPVLSGGWSESAGTKASTSFSATASKQAANFNW